MLTHKLLALLILTVVGLIALSLPRQLRKPRGLPLTYGAQQQRAPVHTPPKHHVGAFGRLSNEALAAKDRQLRKIRGKAKDTLQPKGSKVLLLTGTDGKGHNGAITGLLEQVEANREEYCAYHGYQFVFMNLTKYVTPKKHPVWAKISAIQEALETNPTAEWVWWLDTDAIIMTPEIDLASHLLNPDILRRRMACDRTITLPDGTSSGLRVPCNMDVNNIDMVVSQDHNGVNAGSIFFRRTEWSTAFLDMWADPMYVNGQFERQEQDVLNHIIINHPKLREHVAIIPQRVINAYSVGGDEMGWVTGDLVVHFAGCWVSNDCDKRWQDFWNRRFVVKPTD
ncbi:galactosyl transferase GMA12/MNN10 family-domain-containing protein [Lipomyces kononenkoae]|uniref:Galactosyl transferase GMA12/MNN10 family-domain-containing protein n=1 Tax=Lipomyces kononenkoae TaxID=34357 RepID=A0ACC3T5E1_LIPKO